MINDVFGHFGNRRYPTGVPYSKSPLIKGLIKYSWVSLTLYGPASRISRKNFIFKERLNKCLLM